MTDATMRQRRSLMVITLIIILTYHGGVSFSNELKLFGTSLKVKNPDVILSFIYVAQAYFVWRFYQYFHLEKTFTALRNQYSKELGLKFDSILQAHIFKSLPKGISTFMGSYSYSDLSRTDVRGKCYEVNVEYPTGEVDKHLFELISVPKKIFRFKSVPIKFAFVFRGKILTDFYLPFVLVLYSIPLHFL